MIYIQILEKNRGKNLFVSILGYIWAEDKEHCEEYGRMLQADPSKVSPRAKKRGLPQVLYYIIFLVKKPCLFVMWGFKSYRHCKGHMTSFIGGGRPLMSPSVHYFILTESKVHGRI